MVAEVALLQKYFGFGRTALRSALLASSQQATKHNGAATTAAAPARAGAATSASAAARSAVPERLGDRDMIELLFSKHV